MKKEIMQVAFTVAVATMVIYLVRKKIVENNKRKVQKNKDNEFISKQRRKFSDAYGEYTL